MTPEQKQIWIEKRYGTIHYHCITLYVATVPVYGGRFAEGDGFSQSDAVESLYKDLTYIENPAVDKVPEPVR